MPFQRGDVVLVIVPYTDYRGSKLRPAIIAGGPHPSNDELLIPLSSRISALSPGEFILTDWKPAGLNVPSKVRRFVLTIDRAHVGRRLGRLSDSSLRRLDAALKSWFGLQ
jgi:mRNA interferase MazF